MEGYPRKKGQQPAPKIPFGSTPSVRGVAGNDSGMTVPGSADQHEPLEVPQAQQQDEQPTPPLDEPQVHQQAPLPEPDPEQDQRRDEQDPEPLVTPEAFVHEAPSRSDAPPPPPRGAALEAPRSAEPQGDLEAPVGELGAGGGTTGPQDTADFLRIIVELLQSIETKLDQMTQQRSQDDEVAEL